MIRWLIPLVVGIGCWVVSFMEGGFPPDFEQFMIGCLFLYVASIMMNLEEIVKALFVHNTALRRIRSRR